MNPVSLLPILPILFLAMAAVYLVNMVMPIPIAKGHYAAIDGIRGYLAFFVFLHHSAIWYFFVRFGYWGAPPSHVYNHFGPTSVALFFMITAFLFFRKLIKARSGTMDWLQLYLSRIMRIMPLYVVVLLAFFIIVGIISGFSLHVSFIDLVVQALQWLLFMSPDVNGVSGTWVILAGIIGSLSFEWLFYFSLAIIGLTFFKIRTPIHIIVYTIIFLLLFIFTIQEYYPRLAILRVVWFGGGIAAAFLVDSSPVKRIAASRVSSILILILLIIAVLFFPSIDSFLPLICVTIAFIGIACGNTLFGFLTHTTSRQLGQISYSIFMWHGLLLFLTFRFLLGGVDVRAISAVGHWIIIAMISIVLILLSSITYHYIEAPFMDAAKWIAARVSKIFNKDTKAIKA